MKDKEFWDLVEKLDWDNGHDSNKAKGYLMAKFPTWESIEPFCNKYREVLDKLRKDMGDAFGWPCCDSYDDLTAHIVGMGRKEWKACRKRPERAMKRYKSYKYEESFSYCFPYESDYKKTTLDGFSKWIERELNLYEEATEDGFCDVEFATVLNALKLLKDNKVEAFINTEEVGKKASERIAEETVKRIKKALGPNSLICLDGGSVSNKWGMWNLYTDVKCYLYPQLKAG